MGILMFHFIYILFLYLYLGYSLVSVIIFFPCLQSQDPNFAAKGVVFVFKLLAYLALSI